MSDFIYQRAIADGSPRWTNGTGNLDGFAENLTDLLRFHRGHGFVVNGHPVERMTAAVDDACAFLKNGSVGDTHTVTSRSDGFAVKLRKQRNPSVTKGGLIVANARGFAGTPYVFGVTDCSWLSEASYKPETGDDWVHNAHAQHLMFGSRAGYVSISREQVRVGDLLFIDADRHVAVYAGRLEAYGNIECVIDTEPHDTGAPSGWPTPNLQTGVRARPMIGNYYCSWQYVNGIGRVVEINGAP